MDGAELELELECECGQVVGEAVGLSPRRVNHIVCMCDDCQAYAHWLGQAQRMLDGNGGTEIVQTAPARVRLRGGRDGVRCLRLTERGLLRWYAGCCRTPLGNTMASPRVPFVGVHVSFVKAPGRVDDVAGPIVARVQGKFGYGRLPEGASLSAPPGVVLRAAGRLALWALRREHRPHPFFGADGAPLTMPQVVPAEERESLRPMCGRAPAWPPRSVGQ